MMTMTDWEGDQVNLLKNEIIMNARVEESESVTCLQKLALVYEPFFLSELFALKDKNKSR